MKVFILIIEELADRKQMDSTVSRVIASSLDKEELARFASNYNDEHGLCLIWDNEDPDNPIWWDADEGFTTMHITSFDLQI